MFDSMYSWINGRDVRFSLSTYFEGEHDSYVLIVLTVESTLPTDYAILVATCDEIIEEYTKMQALTRHYLNFDISNGILRYTDEVRVIDAEPGMCFFEALVPVRNNLWNMLAVLKKHDAQLVYDDGIANITNARFPYTTLNINVPVRLECGEYKTKRIWSYSPMDKEDVLVPFTQELADDLTDLGIAYKYDMDVRVGQCLRISTELSVKFVEGDFADLLFTISPMICWIDEVSTIQALQDGLRAGLRYFNYCRGTQTPRRAQDTTSYFAPVYPENIEIQVKLRSRINNNIFNKNVYDPEDPFYRDKLASFASVQDIQGLYNFIVTMFSSGPSVHVLEWTKGFIYQGFSKTLLDPEYTTLDTSLTKLLFERRMNIFKERIRMLECVDQFGSYCGKYYDITDGQFQLRREVILS